MKNTDNFNRHASMTVL